MGRHILSSNSIGQTYYDVDTDGTYRIVREADVTELLEANKARRNDGTNGWVSEAKEWQEVAEIPVDVLHLWKHMYGLDWEDDDDRKKIRKTFLNSSDWAWLRTGGGRL